MREDIFTGILVAEFLEPEVNICDSAVVRISGGPKYPEDKFPLGLNGFLIENIIRKMDQPQLPEVIAKLDFLNFCNFCNFC